MSKLTARIGMELLEGRDCPSTTNLFNGVLTVTGTQSNDNIQVTESLGRILVNGESFDANSISTVVITAQGGDDVIRDDTSKPSVIYGGVGSDWIYAGRGGDVIYGGHGNDTLFGGPGDDRVLGGAGDDTLVDNGGVNVLRQGSPYLTRSNTAVEAEIINLVNAFRLSNGVAPLAVSPRLNVAADIHGLDMAAIGTVYGPQIGMQHTLTGTTRPELSDRLDAVGYDQWTTSFGYGENIAYGYPTAAAVVDGWINSPGHRANILNGSFTETGVSVRYDASGLPYYTQVFGTLA